MKKTLMRGAAIGLALASILVPRQAAAFYPLGGYDINGVLRFAVWPLAEMDTNGDGDVQEGEGVPLIFESGDWGFQDGDIQSLMTGFNQWGGVPTSFAAFRFQGKTPDVLETASDLTEGAIDFLNYVAFDFSDAEDESPAGDVIQGAVGITVMSFAIDDTEITIDGRTYSFTGGQMIDVDFVLNGDLYTDPDPTNPIPLTFPLPGVAVTLGGYALGMNNSPLTNPTDLIVDPADETTVIGITEDRVVPLPDRNGILRLSGTTSSMQANLVMLYSDDDSDSRFDLAPDDMAGISFLYPRANQQNFASIQQQARTLSRPGAPTDALEGAHIVAWCDVDNDASTLPVPFVDTLTGLYELNPAHRYVFDLKGLFKQLQTEEGTLFEPSYIFSCAVLDPLGGEELSDFDSTHGGAFFSFDNPLQFSTLFSAQVFNEFGNLLGLASVPAGTPLRFDPGRNRFVSVDTNKSISQMLPGNTPMFGTRDQTCPLLVATKGEVAAMAGIQALRGFRDSTLLQSAPGLALADAYYRAAPTISDFLRAHGWALATVRAAFYTFVWFLGHPYVLPLMLLAPVGLWLARRRSRLSRRAAAAAVIVFLALSALPSSAQELPITDKQLVGWSEDIVVGKVASVESHWNDKRQIVTDVTVSVDDTLKGRLNKGGQVTFQVLGGRVGAIVTYSPQLARFAEGEDVVVYLKSGRNGGKTVAAGRRGKHAVQVDETTKERLVVKPGLISAPEPVVTRVPREAGARLKSPAAAQPAAPQKDVKTTESGKFKVVPYEASKLGDRAVPLDEYKDDVRRLVREEQEAAAK